MTTTDRDRDIGSRDELDFGETINDFPVATKDRFNQFRIPEKLYGRNIQIGQILNAFARSREGLSLIVVR